MTVDRVHRAGSAVTLLAYNEPYDTVVSADDKGMLEYWQAVSSICVSPVRGRNTDLGRANSTNRLNCPICRECGNTSPTLISMNFAR